MALQNILGMICDPVANRVEVPCLGKNVLAASNALACANMALAGFDAVIPLDEVIDGHGPRSGRACPANCAARPWAGCRSPRHRRKSKNVSPAVEFPAPPPMNPPPGLSHPRRAVPQKTHAVPAVNRQ